MINELIKQRELLVRNFTEADESEWRSAEKSLKAIQDFDNTYGNIINTLIPTKTLNPSEKKGFVNLTKNEIQALKDCYIHSNIRKDHDLIENALAKLQANGEKPEEVNPVGQVILKDLIQLRIILKNPQMGFRNDCLNLLNPIIKTLKDNKPLTTTKEQPKSKCKCTEGFQDVCENYINSGPLREHCSLNCTDNFRPLG